MIGQNVKERRQFVRAKRVLAIEYRRADKSRKASAWHLSTTEDMSLGGIKFYSEIELRSGDMLEIRVVMSGVLDIFKGLVKVVRVEKKASSSYFVTAAQFIKSSRKPSLVRASAKKVATLKRPAKRIYC